MPVGSRIERWFGIWYRFGTGSDEVRVGCFWRVDDDCRALEVRCGALISSLRGSLPRRWKLYFHSTTWANKDRENPLWISGVSANQGWCPCDTGDEVFKDGMAPWKRFCSRVSLHSTRRTTEHALDWSDEATLRNDNPKSPNWPMAKCRTCFGAAAVDWCGIHSN